MAVSISDLDAILKEFYLGPIIESLNNQLEMVQLFTKATLDWQGRQVVIPVHVSRNDGTGYRAELGTLPTAGKQGYVNLNVTARFLYGRFSLTGPAISTAKTTANSFATYVQSEMDGLVTDTKLKANQAMFTGGGCVGFIHERTAGAVAAGAAVPYSFTGNKDVLTELQAMQAVPLARAATHSAKLQIDIIRLDTYASVVLPALPADPFVAGNAVTLDATVGAANVVSIESFGACTYDTSNIAGTYASMIRVVGWGEENNAGGTFLPYDVLTPGLTDGLVKQRVDSENNGVYGNMGLQSHFTVNRNLVANASLRSTVQAISVAGNGAVHANQALNFGRMQSILDEIMVLGGDDPDCIYVHPGMRQKYADLLVFNAPGSIKKAATGDTGTGDPGFSGYAFNGIPVKMSRHCGKGLMVFLKTKTWTIAELQSFGMADLDGNVLSRLSNQDAYEGFVRWYYNLVCKEPNRNAILCGIDFPA